MRKITLFFAAMLFAITAFAATETVYFVNANNWTGTINAYAWTSASNAAWPGVAITKEADQLAGYDVYSYSAEAGTYANVIFNNGSSKTADLTWTAGKYYVKDGWYTAEEAVTKLGGPVEYETVYFVDASGWGSANIYTWSPEVKSWPGLAMTKEAEQIGGKDVYSYTVEKGTSFGGMLFNGGGDDKKTSDLTWTAGKYYVQDGWYTKEEVTNKLGGPATWTIAGTIPCLGAEWATDKTENDLVEGENGVWTKTYAGVTLEAGTYEYKIAKNHMWGEAYPSQNATLEIAADGKYDVTFTFDANAKTVNATAEKLCVKASWSFDGGITAAESGNLVLDKFTNVIVAFSGIDSVGREVTSVAGQGSSTNILFYEVLADGSLIPVEGNGLMYPKSSGKTVTYSLQAKNYKAVESGTYNYLKQGNYRIVLDGDAGVAGTGDILFKPNRSGLPKVYNEEVFTFDFKIVNDYVARYAQSANFEVTPAYDRFAAPTLLESLSEIIVKFTDYESITVNATYGDNQTYIPCVVSENGANVEKAQVKWEAVEGTPNALRLYIDEAVTATGTYGITIPEGLVTFKKTAAEEAYNEAIALSYTVAQKNITEGLKLYYDFSAVEAWKTLPYVGAVLADGSTETIVDLVNISEGLWELTVPAGAYFHVTVNLGNSSTELVGSATTLFYDGTNNLYTLKADAPYVKYGMAELGDFTLSVYPTEPEVVPTIVGGTKLYLKSDLGVSSSSAYGYNVVFGEFEVPSSGGSGGSVRPMQQAGSLGGTTTIPGTAMTKVYTKEGKYDIWEVVAPEGTADSIFNIVVSRKGTMISGYITPLEYDGEHNMFMLPENFAFDSRTPIADETAGEWGIYVEGEYSDPDPIVGTWNIEEGAVLESFESATITFTGVESAAAKSSYTNYFFYKVAEDGTETLVPSMCSDGYMDAAAEGTSVTFSIDVEGCYLDMPQYGAYFALTSGDYRIKVPAGAIKFNGDATNLNTEEYVLNFSLNVPAAAEPVEAVYTVDPENNSTVAEIREIVLTFTEYETITVAEPDLSSGSNIPPVLFGSMPTGMYMMFGAGEAANTLKLYVDPQYAGGMEAFTTEGEYKIVIPEGVVTFGEAGLNKTIELNYTVEAAQPIEVTITGKVKRAVQTGTASIVLTHEEDGTAHIYSVDNETLAITELSQEGVIARDAENAGDYLALSDIALTTDGKLVACNYVQTQYNADNVKDGYKRGMANFYIWNDLAGAPSIWFQSKAASNSLTSDQGYTMAVQGTSTDAQILVSGLRAEGSMRYSLFKVIGGVYEDIDSDAGITTNDHYFYFGVIKDGANFKVSTHGENYEFNVHPNGNWVYDGELAEPSEISVPTSTKENPVVEGVIAEGTFGKKFNGVSYLTVDEQVLMAAPFANEEGLLEGVRVLDITKGFAEATMFETTALLETAVAVESAAVTFVEGTEGYVDLYLFAGSEIYTFEQKVEKEQQNPVDVENGELVVDVYSENGSVYVEVEAGVMVEAYTVDGLCVYSEVSKSATTVIEGLNTNMAIIRVNGVAYKVFVK